MNRNPASGRRPLFRRPTVLIGTDATLLGHPVITPAQAAAVGMFGFDLDLRRSWRGPAEEELARLTTTRVRSVWLPAHYTGILAEPRATRLRAFLTHAVIHSGLRTIVLPGPSAARSQGVPLGQVARQIAGLHSVRIAMAVDAADTLSRSGSHLDRVANMRRMAEEWDLDIALDLTSEDIGQWEAEATLMRLFPRLTLVRMCPLHEADGTHAQTSPAAAALRSVAMLADQAYGGLVSVSPQPRTSPWLSWLSRPNIELAGAARQEILDTYDRIDQYDATHWQPHQQRP